MNKIKIEMQIIEISLNSLADRTITHQKQIFQLVIAELVY